MLVAANANTMRVAEDRQAHPATRLMVDEMILDYLLYMATKEILQDRKAQNGGGESPTQDHRADLHLSMVDCR